MTRSLPVPVLALAILFLSGHGHAADRPVEARVVVENPADLETLGAEVSIEAFDGLEAQVVGPPGAIERLIEDGWDVSILPAPKMTGVTMCTPGWENLADPPWNCYPTYGQYVSMMRRLAESHPAICVLHDFGATGDATTDHRLLALEITDAPEIDEPEPEVFLTSSMHGDETAGYILMLRLAFELTETYGADPALTELVDAAEIWINPLANPDGTYFGGDSSVRGAIRYLITENGGISWVDPNRNFPDPRAGDHPDGNPWQPETEAMMALAEDRSFVLSANFHGGAELVNYPWDTWCERHPDDRWFFELSSDWAAAAHEDGPPGYLTDCPDPLCTGGSCTTPGVTNGADWYSVAGGRQDYMTYFEGGRELTIELSSTKLVPSEDLESLWLANRRALLGFIRASERGIHGIVTGSGRPLEATITILDHDTEAARSAVRTDPAAGDFHRLLPPGRYDLRIAALGRKPRVLTGVEIPEDGPYPLLDIELEPTEARERPREESEY